MAKITIVGDAVVVTSELKLEDIKKVKKYRPEALYLRDEETKEPYFAVGVTRGKGDLCSVGAEFGGATHDDEKRAVITMALGNIPEGANVKEVVAETIGTAILNLNKIEAKIPAVLDEIEAEKANIMSNISFAQ